MAQWNGCTSQCQDVDATTLKLGQRAYDGCLAALDREIGWLLEQLESRGRLDNTILIVTSDHGEHFGEHGIVNHGRSLYRAVVHVPLIIVAPGRVPEGIRVAQPVSMCDLPATMLTLSGQHDRAAEFPGRTLSRFWSHDDATAAVAAAASDERGESHDAGDHQTASPVLTEVSKGVLVPEWLPNAHGSVRSIWHDGFQYIRRSDNGEEELYDVLNDPDEMTNLATLPNGLKPLQECRKAFQWACRRAGEDRSRINPSKDTQN
jgi:arylsulfatase A-like enzyme